ncbi:MAG: hypothetical protein UZ17_ACD001001605 [Acidobacteria bacterium OLB17]|nr:MAG: hypothetical protein UZ17_ACD001001605 [Acidobacteria bacterium OLB17]MCZ2391406.1 DUF1990 domain-containing protein [Acidobacteriota bacterium]
MFRILRPDDGDVSEFLAKAAGGKLSYSATGATSGEIPSGYNVDHNRALLGHGTPAFERAKEAIRTWTMFDLGWVTLVPNDTPIEVGRNVAIVVSHLGFYSMSSARIVYVLDEPTRFGFAYGTLGEHVESGEERFSVDFDPETGEVWYDLLAFSQPNALLARLGYPISRYLQRSFARDSMASMKRAVSSWAVRVIN